MLEYIKIYKIVKTQLEAYALASNPPISPDEVKKLKAKVSSQYVEFLPDTYDDTKNIEQFENDTVTEEQIESAAKFFLNPKSTVSSMVPVTPKPPAKPPTAATTASTAASTASTAASTASTAASTATATTSILTPAQVNLFNNTLNMKGFVIDKDLNIKRLKGSAIVSVPVGKMYLDSEVNFLNTILNTIKYSIDDMGTLSKLP
jgi:hypothetical protein